MNKWLKLSLQIVLGVAVAVLAVIVYKQIMDPLDFNKQVATRETAVIERIKDIRSAEQAFKQKYQHYTADFDSLINFVLNDSLDFERKLVDENDSVAMAQLKRLKRENSEKFVMAVKDTIFSPKKFTAEQIRDIRYIPFAQEGTEYILNAGMLTTESKVVVPVFEAKAPYKDFLYDLNKQMLVNLIADAKDVYYKYPGIAVGSIEKATNDAGNWE